MKRNLLMLLFAMLMCTFISRAQEVTFTVDIDKAANATVTMNSPYGDPIALHDGLNTVVGEANRPLFVTPVGGAELTVNVDGMDLTMGGGGFYNTLMVEGMEVKITSSGEESDTVNVYFYINNPGSAYITAAGERFELVSSGDILLPAGEYATVYPMADYEIEEFDPYGVEEFEMNEDGTVTFMPVPDGYISLRTKMVGTDFTVKIPVADNVIVKGYAADNTELGVISLMGGSGTFSATAKTGVAALGFEAPAGGEIRSIKRITADGAESNVNFSGYVGWRAMLAEGDTFVVDAAGPEVDVKFWGYDTHYQELDLSAFVVKAGETILDLSGLTADAKVRLGDVLSVTAGKGYELKSSYAVSGDAGDVLVTYGVEQTFMVTRAGNVFLYAAPISGMIINVDNAAAVTVKGANGYGDVLSLTDGENRLETVVNPLLITANATYEIASVTLDGKALTADGGSYLAELSEGSTLIITTREAAKPFPVTIMTMNGEISDLVIMQDGKEVAYEGLEGINGTELQLAARLGYIIESVSDMNGNKVSFDEATGLWTVEFSKGLCMISVNFRQPAEGKAFVGFRCNTTDYMAFVYDKDGVMKSDPEYIESGNTAEVEIGDQVKIRSWFSDYELTKITVNGETIDLEAGASSSGFIKIEGKTVIEVEAVEKERLVEVSGDTAIDVVTGSGVNIGYIYINEEGNFSTELRPGDKFYVIPVAEKGYKFDGFKYMSYEFTLPDMVDGKYELTVPEDVQYLIFQGRFVPDSEKKAYLIEGNSIYEGLGDGDTETRLMGLTRIDNGTEQGALTVLAYEGEQVKLLFYQNIDLFPADRYEFTTFCLYNDPEVAIPQLYTVNPEHVRSGNIISIGAVLVDKTLGVDEIDAEGRLFYDASADAVSSPADVKVFTVAGQLVKEIPAGAASLSSLPSGIYILTNGSQTIKISK